MNAAGMATAQAGGTRLFVADAQVHIWGPNTPERPWKDTVKPHRATPLGAEELLDAMNRAGVDRAILVPPSWDANRNDLCLEAARKCPERFGVMGRLDLAAPESRTRVAGWLDQPGMYGLRVSLNRGAAIAALAENQFDWLFAEAERAHVPLMLMLKHSQMDAVDRIAVRHADLKIALCHLSLDSSKRDEEAFRDLDKLLALAKRPNVCVKVSALPTYTTDRYPYRALHPYLRRVYDAYGPQRMFWGTDLARLPCTYRQSVTMFTEEIPWLATQDKSWIMGRGLCEWLNWEMPAAA